MLALREKKVGPYTVRELTMRETMRMLNAHPEGSAERGAAVLGASVFNGSGEPLGDSVLDVGQSVYRLLMQAYDEVNAAPDFATPAGEGDAGNA